MEARRQTAADRVRQTLADDIVRGVIGPGVSLDEATLAERFQVSRTPVREAIRQLEGIGFAVARPHRGAVVPHFTAEKLTEMFSVMAELEALCAAFAASNATPEGLQLLENVHLECRRAASGEEIDRYYEQNIRFHEAIYRIGGNAFLAEITTNVRNRVAPFRQAQFRISGRLSRSVEEHEAIVLAIGRGDAEAAARAMREHMRVVRRSVGEVAPALEAGA